MFTKELKAVRYELEALKEEEKEKSISIIDVKVVALSEEEDKTKKIIEQLVKVKEHDHTLLERDQIILEENHINKFSPSKFSTTVSDHQDLTHDQDTTDDDLCHFRYRNILPKKKKVKDSLPNSVLGHCKYYDAKAIPPPGGYLKGIDYYHHREGYEKRENCFLRCVKDVKRNEIDGTWLINATKMGLPKVVQELHTNFGLDPLFTPDEELNAVQEGIRTGYAEIVKILSNSNNEMVIDEYGRTIADYVRMKGSPIRPVEAKSILGLNVDSADEGARGRTLKENEVLDDTVDDNGWNQETKLNYSERCDFDVVDNEMPQDAFLRDYFETGRPFVLRGHVPKAEKAAFSKDRWDYIRKYNTHSPVWKVGPTAYPTMTGQEYCSRKFTIAEVENATECEEMPGVPMVSVWHPKPEEFNLLFPMYEDGEFYELSGYRKVADWFGIFGDKWKGVASWQVFFGGDGSGATLHWHNAAFNVLYVGTKEWRVTPPKYKGMTGMQPMNTAKQLDESYTLRCTQHEGDIIYVPSYWGHMTMNHGFTIGAAIIIPEKNYKKRRDVGKLKKNVVHPEQETIPFLFVNINKTGGSIIMQMLNTYCENDYIKERWGDNHKTIHSTSLSYIDHYGRAIWNKAYTFVVVRHPLQRQVSNYFFIASKCVDMGVCEDTLIQPFARGNKMTWLTDEEKVSAFHEWVLDLYNLYPPGSDFNYRFGSLGNSNEDMISFNSSQTSWIVDGKDDIAVNEIFHLESLDVKLNKIISSIPCLKSNQRQQDAIKMMQTPNTHPDFKLFAKNKKTNRIINEVYAVDFQNFGYKLL